MLAMGHISRFRLASSYLQFIISFYPPLFLIFYFLLPLFIPLSSLVYFLQIIFVHLYFTPALSVNFVPFRDNLTGPEYSRIDAN